jgi:hypothetical protein
MQYHFTGNWADFPHGLSSQESLKLSLRGKADDSYNNEN